ncbi:hypothetical protein BDZ94DRAFT_1253330 [Collybia nuda]|uniref:Transmembrane protein n=1 Tax=Collybia nuda TaxID=64659 RepID=A0A9P5Y8W7_9AGAR|nr:hypothetical protein BDZ94DRAFT_1253330 [Collybia nuda]
MLTSITPSYYRALLTLSLYFVIFFAFIAQVQAKPRNITLSNASPQIVYTPFRCSATVSDDTQPQCPGAWQLVDLGGATFVSTTGPDPATEGANPQMFFQFRASAMYFTTSPLSNATANINISANGTTVATTFDSSVGSVAAVSLRDSAITTVVITFFPVDSYSRLDIGNFTLTVVDNPASTVVFPSMTLPPTASLPTVISPSNAPTSSLSPSPSPVQGVSNRVKVGEAVGIVLGLGLGLTAVAVVLYIIWRRRRLRDPHETDSEASTTSSDDRRPEPPPPPLRRPKKISEKIRTWF